VVTKKTAGVFQTSVNDLTGSFTVEEELNPATTPKPEIVLFSVIPGYDSVTQKPTSAKVIYQLRTLTEPVTNVGLVLKVSFNGKPLEDIILISPGQPISDGTIGTWDYIPATGWRSGTYVFQTELTSGGIPCATTPEETLAIKAEPAAVVNWSILALIIGGIFMATAALVVVLLSRRRQIIRTWVEDGRSSPPTTRRR
jgi:hypothetical protein